MAENNDKITPDQDKETVTQVKPESADAWVERKTEEIVRQHPEFAGREGEIRGLLRQGDSPAEVVTIETEKLQEEAAAQENSPQTAGIEGLEAAVAGLAGVAFCESEAIAAPSNVPNKAVKKDVPVLPKGGGMPRK